MTTIKTKPGGAAPKRSAQGSAKRSVAAEFEKEATRAQGARKEEGKRPDEPQAAPFAEETTRTAGPGAPSAGPEIDSAEAVESGAQATEPGAQTAQDEELSAKYMRLAADFQNYKRRVEKEKSEVYAYANEKIAVDLLAVLDNFERALEAQGGAETKDEIFATGMELIFKQLQDILAKNGVEEIQSLGETFDPAMHHAVMMEATSDYESGKVSAVLGKGYRLRERVIRPAMVKVAE
jgi:molecular chaperone GrpE